MRNVSAGATGVDSEAFVAMAKRGSRRSRKGKAPTIGLIVKRVLAVFFKTWEEEHGDLGGQSIFLSRMPLSN